MFYDLFLFFSIPSMLSMFSFTTDKMHDASFISWSIISVVVLPQYGVFPVLIGLFIAGFHGALITMKAINKKFPREISDKEIR